jgi:hypothetical protein
MSFEYIGSLKPNEKPKYEYLIGLFKEYCTAEHKIDLLIKIEST